MKVQCSCGAKYEFELVPAMRTRPVKFVCPACGMDASEFVDGLVRRELGQSGTPDGPPITLPLETSLPARAPVGLQIQKPRPVPLRLDAAVPVPASPEAAAEAATQEAEAGVSCPRHPTEPATERCYICNKPICPKCMELFGYVCSPLCRGKANSHGIQVPVYGGQRSVREAKLWRKTARVATAVGVTGAVAIGCGFWYEWFGARRRGSRQRWA